MSQKRPHWGRVTASRAKRSSGRGKHVCEAPKAGESSMHRLHRWAGEPGRGHGLGVFLGGVVRARVGSPGRAVSRITHCFSCRGKALQSPSKGVTWSTLLLDIRRGPLWLPATEYYAGGKTSPCSVTGVQVGVMVLGPQRWVWRWVQMEGLQECFGGRIYKTAGMLESKGKNLRFFPDLLAWDTEWVFIGGEDWGEANLLSLL